MTAKEFFRPTVGKVVLTIAVFLVMFFIDAIWGNALVIVNAFCISPPCDYGLAPNIVDYLTGIYYLKTLSISSILVIIYYYIIACIIILAYNKRKGGKAPAAKGGK